MRRVSRRPKDNSDGPAPSGDPHAQSNLIAILRLENEELRVLAERYRDERDETARRFIRLRSNLLSLYLARANGAEFEDVIHVIDAIAHSTLHPDDEIT
jgi:hypothetical protein